MRKSAMPFLKECNWPVMGFGFEVDQVTVNNDLFKPNSILKCVILVMNFQRIFSNFKEMSQYLICEQICYIYLHSFF
jgi:hypothetical protein